MYFTYHVVLAIGESRLFRESGNQDFLFSEY